MDLPFADDAFDVVISRHVLWTMTEPDRAFREWTRVVRPGGEVTWVDGVRPRQNPMNRARELASGGVRRVRRPADHAQSHHYDDELAAQLPFRGLESTQPIRELLADMGVRDVSCRAVPKLQKAERSVQELHKRLAPGSKRYVGRFPVTFELKSRLFGTSAK
ncbi:MAG: class I SAM-dependent methyltransferase [Dehalococcoidia bacterium]|nr:class I SAM-dependent methyltransferase [Dehalococcoidia bacterium]